MYLPLRKEKGIASLGGSTAAHTLGAAGKVMFSCHSIYRRGRVSYIHDVATHIVRSKGDIRSRRPQGEDALPEIAVAAEGLQGLLSLESRHVSSRNIRHE